MHERMLVDGSGGLGESRGRVLQLLQQSEVPLGVQEVAARTGLHANTARFHLDGLVEAGLAQRSTEERLQPGRPRMFYRAESTEQPAGRRSYRLLAEILTSMVSGLLPRPDQAAVQAGRAWGGYLTERPAPYQRIDADEAVRRLRATLTEIGFAPDEVRDSAAPVLPLRHCPFREVAATHQDVVCGLHLGLMQGVLAELNAPVSADRLEPFVEPSLCLAHLTLGGTDSGADVPPGAGTPAP